MTATMGLSQQQIASQDTIDYGNYLQSSHNRKVLGTINDRYQLQNNQNLKQNIRDHNTSFTSTKGLLNGPGQNNCFLNSAVQTSDSSTSYRNDLLNCMPYLCTHIHLKLVHRGRNLEKTAGC
ncbi:hypothetical protein KQX54_020000 [Cotesia glomerata]|uniref:Uncharacterized protein n=1 Tax=Cotesia glomerata TaxID=32391 RepID=A0AAV7J9A3_COTGL|nr:hypothetical protein KQX54_020000 [Cotesia glomerata]